MPKITIQKSKLIHHLQLLSPEELKRLLKFLKSPFFSANTHLVQLYLILRPHYPLFDSRKLTHERIFKKLFPNRPYDHQKLLNLLSDFVTLLKKYLQLLQLEKEEQLQGQLLLKAYAERPAAYPAFQKYIQKTEKRLEKLPYRNSDYYRQKFHLSRQYFNHPGTDQFQLSKRLYDEAMQHLDRSFLLEKLLLSCEMKAREKPLAESYDIWLLPELRQGITRYPIESPIAKAYVEMLDLLEKEEPASYFRLKELFLNNQPQFTRRQQQNILQSLINYTIRRGNRGEADFLKENLELYQFGLTEQLLMEYGILNDMTYISIVNIALRTGKVAWCRQFIEECGAYLETGTRKDAQSLATALWLYAEQQPKAVIDLLQKVDFLNVYYQVQVRVLLIKIFFETYQEDDTYFELIGSQVASFERYLRRDKTIGETQRSALLNFAIKVKQLAKLRLLHSRDSSEITKLKQELEQLTPLYNKSWLLRQLEKIS